MHKQAFLVVRGKVSESLSVCVFIALLMHLYKNNRHYSNAFTQNLKPQHVLLESVGKRVMRHSYYVGAHIPIVPVVSYYYSF